MGRKPLLLALDFGGTKLSAALAVAGEGRWLALERILSPPDANALSDLDTMLGLSRALLAQVGEPLAAVGVSFGGPVDTRAGRYASPTTSPAGRTSPCEIGWRKPWTRQ